MPSLHFVAKFSGMRKLALVFGILFWGTAWGQNLVENPSIENTGPCPVTDSVFNAFAEPWRSYFGTPDYYNAPCGAPGNPQLTVTEQAFDGNGYAGISVYGDSGLAYIREYLHGELSEPLVAGEKYRITFYVKPHNENVVSYAVNNIGMALTPEPLDSTPFENIYPVTPQVKETNVITNEGFWTAICGIYEARGGEQYICIGNFNTDIETTVAPLTGAVNPFLGYYLIDFVEVVPNDLPELPDDTIICTDQRLDLRIDAPDVDVLWGDGSTSKDFLITEPGTYTARISDPGCSYTDTIVVEPANCDECKVFVPNAFSPNGNGVNELFRVFAEEPPIASDRRCEFRTFRINIFDRWGQKVFEADDPRIGWDGTDGSNNECAQGIYTYNIEYEFFLLRESTTLSKRGTIMLVR